MRRHLLAERERFAASADAGAAAEALGAHLVGLLAALEPDILGLYWPVRSEFNAVGVLTADNAVLPGLPLALPFARRAPVTMAYHRWDRAAPSLADEYGIPTGSGAVTVPDVVLVPCVGFTADGFRLGYGGGYFDRWLAAHPAVTTVGIAWEVGRIAPGEFTPEAHDLPLTMVLTEAGAAVS